MIGRIWHGWTRRADADRYERLLRADILPAVEDRAGCAGAFLLRRVEGEAGEEVEFVTLTLFRDLDAARAFSEDGDRGAVVPAGARALLVRFDDRSRHYRVRRRPDDAEG